MQNLQQQNQSLVSILGQLSYLHMCDKSVTFLLLTFQVLHTSDNMSCNAVTLSLNSRTSDSNLI